MMTLSPKDKLIYHCRQLVDVAEPFILEQLLKYSRVTVDDFQDEMEWDDHFYTRNVVASGKWFELLVMCWLPGQGSMIHDHGESSCALKVLEGEVTEDNYGMADTEGYTNKVYSLCFKRPSTIAASAKCIHRLSNQTDKRLVTLHLYSKPIANKMGVYYCEDN